jgi:transposase InsO family protein
VPETSRQRHKVKPTGFGQVLLDHQVEYAIVEWVGWYNHHRMHTAIGDVPPIEYETAYYRSINTPALTGTR